MNPRESIRFDHPHDRRYRAIVEDNGRVCYAYLQDTSVPTIVGDVWLYNKNDPGELIAWKSPDARMLMPFRNPRACCVAPALPCGDLRRSVRWFNDDRGVVAEVVLGRAIHAEIWRGSHPGRCSNARTNGPCAVSLEPSSCLENHGGAR